MSDKILKTDYLNINNWLCEPLKDSGYAVNDLDGNDNNILDATDLNDSQKGAARLLILREGLLYLTPLELQEFFYQKCTPETFDILIKYIFNSPVDQSDNTQGTTPYKIEKKNILTENIFTSLVFFFGEQKDKKLKELIQAISDPQLRQDFLDHYQDLEAEKELFAQENLNNRHFLLYQSQITEALDLDIFSKQINNDTTLAAPVKEKILAALEYYKKLAASVKPAEKDLLFLNFKKTMPADELKEYRIVVIYLEKKAKSFEEIEDDPYAVKRMAVDLEKQLFFIHLKDVLPWNFLVFSLGIEPASSPNLYNYVMYLAKKDNWEDTVEMRYPKTAAGIFLDRKHFEEMKSKGYVPALRLIRIVEMLYKESERVNKFVTNCDKIYKDFLKLNNLKEKHFQELFSILENQRTVSNRVIARHLKSITIDNQSLDHILGDKFADFIKIIMCKKKWEMQQQAMQKILGEEINSSFEVVRQNPKAILGIYKRLAAQINEAVQTYRYAFDNLVEEEQKTIKEIKPRPIITVTGEKYSVPAAYADKMELLDFSTNAQEIIELFNKGNLAEALDKFNLLKADYLAAVQNTLKNNYWSPYELKLFVELSSMFQAMEKIFEKDEADILLAFNEIKSLMKQAVQDNNKELLESAKTLLAKTNSTINNANPQANLCQIKVPCIIRKDNYGEFDLSVKELTAEKKKPDYKSDLENLEGWLKKAEAYFVNLETYDQEKTNIPLPENTLKIIKEKNSSAEEMQASLNLYLIIAAGAIDKILSSFKATEALNINGSPEEVTEFNKLIRDKLTEKINVYEGQSTALPMFIIKQFYINFEMSSGIKQETVLKYVADCLKALATRDNTAYQVLSDNFKGLKEQYDQEYEILKNKINLLITTISNNRELNQAVENIYTYLGINGIADYKKAIQEIGQRSPSYIYEPNSITKAMLDNIPELKKSVDIYDAQSEKIKNLMFTSPPANYLMLNREALQASSKNKIMNFCKNLPEISFSEIFKLHVEPLSMASQSILNLKNIYQQEAETYQEITQSYSEIIKEIQNNNQGLGLVLNKLNKNIG
ncbi:MAG: hypothetical protein KKA19_03580, partial [Candidatus Margulisbacteria bacterium]|nr:hypothetical protein [Candidatus Margulisiibacteriota bacterium]